MPSIALLVLLILCTPGPAPADILEEVLEVPIRLRTIYGQEVEQDIKVTIFRDEQRAKAPYLVLNHGRPLNDAGIRAMKRQRFPAVSRYFVSRGFVVIVPTRAGYGESGGKDVEHRGKCENPRFAPAFSVAADQIVEVLKYARTLRYVDTSRGLVVGQSFGGVIAVTLSTKDVPGLAGAVNFAGGSGGNPLERPGNPCGKAAMFNLLQEYGAKSKVPTLWLYSENDRLWGPNLPKEWFQGFIKAGGNGKFVPLPPFKEDGHGIFTGNPEAWKPVFEEFLRTVGLGSH